ncbi:glutamine ABC transporter permease [Fructilactobacillus lindneri]|uniref:Amino acid ABC transporter periplasmic protein n=2 Tax=Fructilactobacillus lindneri TaxID=53444 RepID=A0A0R2JT96_9LACO|nr:amino acid ABC transporter permease [Fructilactobacillus lindneri]ANZ57574.1 glutamine ABC transporter permease [Fructilactobacillus lindneri]ANZ58843.1 glutamine ABC transporter permease [Fructilactobacillus lindneri]KRN78236.1 amino acid ABC transporter periplasmic protein [Fructilactobacillus lindneri DSM 20690 = JCM 11027]POG97726.1 glutamine ABC transporter permease [Fructilactobacillus lindneri]POH00050.1 glutamine ABC transporter permease [Fructilactobacillus lindneri]
MINIFMQNWQTILNGFWITILSSLIGLGGSLLLGTIFALMELAPNKILKFIGNAFVEFFRNIPLLVITLFFYVVVAKDFKISGFWAGTIGLILYTSAFVAECIRGGINSVDEGQMEGARANGLTYTQAMIHIVLPQGFKLAIPSLGNQFINLVKNSSILSFVAGFDLMYQANVISGANLDPFNTYIIVGIFYLIITGLLSTVMRQIEDRLGKGRLQ